MENSQNAQQQPSQSEAAIPESGKRIPGRAESKNLLIHLLVHYPLLFPFGLLLIFIGSSTLALYSLGYVGRVRQEEPEIAEAEIIKPIKVPSETINPTPLWMVAAIALSCASGSLILFLLLNRPANRQQFKNQINRHYKRVAQQRRPDLEPRPKKNQPVFVPSQVRAPVVVMPSQTQPVVTVLPPEQNILPSQAKESLANMLDMRKHTPLSTILRKD
ncbi:hypothetical protein [Brasilonema sp. UFV-L1]|uniref:hypothetical protein n=1 Tax=Brasilonema sp. UFV-L1 TaxID=2234130 RepID=UPI00145C67B4|nr:hypothetical protein [Brasilonema sp. UFV-L1]NMG08049.1 hypothetical protein [Brasilonema sp. UFV-L1]